MLIIIFNNCFKKKTPTAPCQYTGTWRNLFLGTQTCKLQHPATQYLWVKHTHCITKQMYPGSATPWGYTTHVPNYWCQSSKRTYVRVHWAWDIHQTPCQTDRTVSMVIPSLIIYTIYLCRDTSYRVHCGDVCRFRWPIRQVRPPRLTIHLQKRPGQDRTWRKSKNGTERIRLMISIRIYIPTYYTIKNHLRTHYIISIFAAVERKTSVNYGWIK